MIIGQSSVFMEMIGGLLISTISAGRAPFFSPAGHTRAPRPRSARQKTFPSPPLFVYFFIFVFVPFFRSG